MNFTTPTTTNTTANPRCEAFDENHNRAFVRCWRDARRIQMFTYTPGDGAAALELRLCHAHANRNLDGDGRGYLILADREIVVVGGLGDRPCIQDNVRPQK